MIAVDINVLIRILVEDPGAALQMQSARALLDKAVCNPPNHLNPPLLSSTIISLTFLTA